jgi:dihydroflavonol-4-reductase
LRPTLVTGASGFVGWHVARLLREAGHPVKALVRPTSGVRQLDVERMEGDLRDRTSLDQAVRGCALVFHVAADYRLWAKDPRELYHSNVDGTRNLLEACESAGVERVVYTSTVGCIGVPRDGIGDENHPVTLGEMAGHYKRSKFLAERIALDFSKRIDLVVVNPTAPVGDHDFKPTPTGKILVDYLRGKMPAFVDTGLNLVDVGDVAQGHLLAAGKGRRGERYILGCENLTLARILEHLAGITGGRAPRVRLPLWVAWAAGAVSTGWAEVTGQPPRVPLEGVRMATKKMFVSHTKATSELGYSPGPVDAALRNAVEWFRSEGVV